MAFAFAEEGPVIFDDTVAHCGKRRFRIRKMYSQEFSSPVANQCAACLICIHPGTRARWLLRSSLEKENMREKGQNLSYVYSFVRSVFPLLPNASHRVVSRLLTLSRRHPFILRYPTYGISFLIPFGMVFPARRER